MPSLSLSQALKIGSPISTETWAKVRYSANVTLPSSKMFTAFRMCIYSYIQYRAIYNFLRFCSRWFRIVFVFVLQKSFENEQALCGKLCGRPRMCNTEHKLNLTNILLYTLVSNYTVNNFNSFRSLNSCNSKLC